MNNSLQYSAEVDIYLEIAGSRIDVAGCLGDKCTVWKSQDLPPASEGELVIVVDGTARRKQVRLPYGMSKDRDEVITEPIP